MKLMNRGIYKPPLLLRQSKPFCKLKFLLIFMASISSLTLLSFLLLFFISTAARNHHNHSPISKPPSPKAPSYSSIPFEIQEACKASRDPSTCEAALVQHFPSKLTTPLIIQSALGVSSENLKKAQSMVKNILDASTGNLNRTNAAKVCIEVLRYSEYRLNLTADAFPRGVIKRARAWMSGAMVYQYDCWSALKYVNGTSQVNETMAFLNSLIGYSSNALGMMVNYDNFGNETGSWGPPKTERDGFWEGAAQGRSQLGGKSSSKPWTKKYTIYTSENFGFPAGADGSSRQDFNSGVPTGMKPNVTVCKAGRGCDYETVQEAVNVAPENDVMWRFVIWIKAGLYEEIVRVPLEKRNLVFLGDGMGKTVITGSRNVGQLGVSTYDSATVGVVGDGFMASGITIQNTAGPDTHQAVAFRSDSDLSIIENCEFLGNQDTLYAHSMRQYYKSCRIQGNVDFIFGNSATIFQDCDILVAPRQLNPEKGENNAVTAHGRIDPAQSTGFVFKNCLINGTADYMTLYYSKPKLHKNFLGRPWKEYSRTVFIQCTLEALVSDNGWMPWSGDFALSTLYYGEFESTGPGANTAGRVSWSSQIPAEHVGSYSLQNFIQGDQWIPTSS